MIRLFVGLGNPGREYEGTRHNAGFWWIDAVARRWRATLNAERSYHGLVARVNHASGPVWLLQPQTFMNLSGKSVAALARFFKIEPQHILVAHDELDLLPGQMKLKQGGRPGGNGVKDVEMQLGSADFWRLRFGIGHPGVKSEVVDYVLRKPPAAEREAIEQNIERSLGALDALLRGDMQAATTHIHAKPPRPKPPKPPKPASSSPSDPSSPGAAPAGPAPTGPEALSAQESQP
jgi:PTH1 family peptidyl-tRNA hydrolase